MLSFGTLFLALLPLLSATPVKRGRAYPPEDVKGPAPLPAWVKTYETAKAAGLIPDLPPSTLVNGNPVYPSGVSANAICSWTVTHCYGAYDVVDAPTSTIGISFDDGPQLASPALYKYLQAQNQSATHFMIGSRILDNPSIFQQAIDTGGHIAVHTWSHPYMTSLTDLQVVGEIGWTAQIINDLSGKIRLSFLPPVFLPVLTGPAVVTPPYGDVDNRVRAIAKEVFGLATVIWNQDTFDWVLEEGGQVAQSSGPQSDADLDTELQNFYHGPKTPGLIILEHELTTRSVGGFMRNYPTLAKLGWVAKSIPDLWNAPWYLEGVAIGSGPAPAIKVANSTSAASSTASKAAATFSSAAIQTKVATSLPQSLGQPGVVYTTVTSTSTPLPLATTAQKMGSAAGPLKRNGAVLVLTALAAVIFL